MATLRPRGGAEEAPAQPNEPTIPTKRQARGGDGARGAAGSLGQDHTVAPLLLSVPENLTAIAGGLTAAVRSNEAVTAK
jgi:hypothetical protein